MRTKINNSTLSAVAIKEEYPYGAPFVSKLLRKLWIRKTKIDSIYIFRLDFYVATQNIDPNFITQKSSRFLLHKNRPDFYTVQKSTPDPISLAIDYYSRLYNLWFS